jgi:hypothetical protein
MAVPFLLSPVATADGDLLVDGAVLCNCPLHAFDLPRPDPHPPPPPPRPVPGGGGGGVGVDPAAAAAADPAAAAGGDGGGPGPPANPATLGFWLATVDRPRKVRRLVNAMMAGDGRPHSLRRLCAR